MKLLFIQTGGTIDKDYPRAAKGYAFEITAPAVERIIENFNLYFDNQILPLLQKDSLDLTPQDRDLIYEACLKNDAKKIIITHDTEVMIETAKHLAAIKDKVIIVTGAMRPERFSNSDASFNLGVAIGAINVLPEGVYIAMNGRCFLYEKVQRNAKTGQFAEHKTEMM
jgi:L-asparaginase